MSRGLGFTLIEVMIVVAIIGILAAVGYPSYQNQMRKGKRAEAKTKILLVAQRLERYYTDNSTYVVDIAPLFGLAAGATVYSGDNSATTSPYSIVVGPPLLPVGATIATGYIITATLVNPSSDTPCGNLTLTSAGVKGFTGTYGTMRECW